MYLVSYDNKIEFQMEHIKSKLTIGNELNVKVRAKYNNNVPIDTDKPGWLTISCGETHCDVTLDPS